jgi:hypothetical protein
MLLAFAALGGILIGSLLTCLHLQGKFHPNLIGVCLGALLGVVIIEAVPLIT